MEEPVVPFRELEEPGEAGAADGEVEGADVCEEIGPARHHFEEVVEVIGVAETAAGGGVGGHAGGGQ